jgi:hypothetical protein
VKFPMPGGTVVMGADVLRTLGATMNFVRLHRTARSMQFEQRLGLARMSTLCESASDR